MSNQTMEIDYQIMNKSVPELFKNIPYVKVDNNNFKEIYFPASSYCSISDVSPYYSFLDFSVQNMGAFLDVNGNYRKIVFSVNTLDIKSFYATVIKEYGKPSSSSLSKYYIEKQGFKIPTEIDKDSLDNYYKQLKEPTIEDLPYIRNSIWYGVGNDSDKVSVNMIIENKTDPESKFIEKEVWITFRMSK